MFDHLHNFCNGFGHFGGFPLSKGFYRGFSQKLLSPPLCPFGFSPAPPSPTPPVQRLEKKVANPITIVARTVSKMLVEVVAVMSADLAVTLDDFEVVKARVIPMTDQKKENKNQEVKIQDWLRRTKASSTATLAVQGMSKLTVIIVKKIRQKSAVEWASATSKRKSLEPEVAYEIPTRAKTQPVTTEW